MSPKNILKKSFAYEVKMNAIRKQAKVLNIFKYLYN
jgi:hypothetical protein